MALRMYEYRCGSCQKLSESLEDYETKEITCECGGTASRVISATKLECLSSGVDLSMPTAADRWARIHREEAKRANKKARDEGR